MCMPFVVMPTVACLSIRTVAPDAQWPKLPYQTTLTTVVSKVVDPNSETLPLSASIVVLSVWSMRQLVDQLDVWPCKDISLARKGRTQITLDHFLSHQKSSSSPCYLSMVSGCEEVDLRAHLRIARAYQQLAILEPSKQLASSDGSIIVSCKISALCHG